jgi:hypothetical protein
MQKVTHTRERRGPAGRSNQLSVCRLRRNARLHVIAAVLMLGVAVAPALAEEAGSLDPAKAAPVQGLRFNPEIFNSSGAPYKEAWLARYPLAEVRSQVKAELAAIHHRTHLAAITLLVNANQHLAWPSPSPIQLQNLTAFINDANAEGLRVILLVSTPCVVPNSAEPLGSGKVHVGGHRKGEIVNGHQLYWDVAYCADDSIELAQSWYSQILLALVQGLESPRGIVYVGLLGNPVLPFATEMNVFYDGFPQLPAAQKYISQLVAYLKPRTPFAIGIGLLPGFWSTDSGFRYSFLRNLRAAVQLSSFDYLDITSSDQIDVSAILARVGPGNAHRIVLSDFKYGESGQSQAAVTAFHLDQVRTRHLGGYWIWQYKDDPALGNQGKGIRQAGYFGNDGGWKGDVVDLLLGYSTRHH